MPATKLFLPEFINHFGVSGQNTTTRNQVLLFVGGVSVFFSLHFSFILHILHTACDENDIEQLNLKKPDNPCTSEII